MASPPSSLRSEPFLILNWDHGTRRTKNECTTCLNPSQIKDKCVQPNAYQYCRYIPKRDVGHPGKGQIIQNNLKHNLGRFSCTFQSASFEIPKIPLVSLGHADLTLFKLTVKERWPNYQKCHFTSNCEWQFPRVGPSFHPSF